MPWTHAGVRKRLKLLGALGVAGGLLLASVTAALAQETTEEDPEEDPNRVSADFKYDAGINLEIPGTFFPGFEAAGSLMVQPRALQVDGAEMAMGTISVEPLRLEESQTMPELIAPNPDKPSGSTVRYLGRAVSISVQVDDSDMTQDVWFNPAMMVSLDLTESEWEEAANDPDVFVLRAWDPDRGMWLTVETSTDPFDKVVTAKVARAGKIAIFIELAPPPIQGGDVSLSSMTLLLIAMAGFALTASGVMMARGIAGRRRR